MFKIKGYLKKFWYLILACICLLFVQAQTELTLPDYKSDIVSVGIQAGGFASPVSDVLTEETYQHLLLFVDQKDQKTVKKDYKKVSKVNQDIIDTFPKAKGKTVYQLKDLSRDERELYKIYIRFNEDKSLSMWADDEEKIRFKLYGTPAYSVTETMDATRPYLKHRYVSFTIEYNFKDVTSRNQEVLYKVKGTMLLERNLNTQIPDEDQQIEW